MKYDVKCPNEKCPEHGIIKEIDKKMSADFPNCLSCGEKTVNVFSSSTLVFKGQGWCRKGS
jgi:hypothetical protein